MAPIITEIQLERYDVIGRQVFFDASGARTRWANRVFGLGYLILFLMGCVFAATIYYLPRPDPVKFWTDKTRLRAPQKPLVGSRASFTGGAPFSASWPMIAGNATRTIRPIMVGFYTPWDDNSPASLRKHIGQLDWLIASIVSVSGPDHAVEVTPDERLDAALAQAKARIAVFPMIQNGIEEDWDGEGAAKLLADPAARAVLLDRIERIVAMRAAPGMAFDFEDLPASARVDYLRLITEAHARFAARRWQVIVTLPADSSDWQIAAFAAAADKVVFKAFGEHGPAGGAANGAESGAGPIAGQRWFADRLARVTAVMGSEKLIVAIGNFAYDWPANGEALPISVEEAWLTARESGAPIRFDQASGNPTFDYEDGTEVHKVWLLDAATGWNQLRMAYASGAAGLAIWRLGTEDSSLWAALKGVESATPPNIALLQSNSNVDVEGSGEILRISAVPTDGRRRIVTNDQGMITGEEFIRLPTPFVVSRTGYRPKTVALTFDDGPDPDWTPQILAILRQKRVPATFFIIGRNAIANRSLLNQIIDQGHELGNHTFTHPNLAIVPDQQAMLELNASQRLVQAYTGRSMRLFRAPYFADAEASTADELRAALLAQENGYINVGLHVDPQDWDGKDAPAIVQSVLAQVAGESSDETRQIVLLHDGGGNRSQTVAALPLIIDELRARGYQLTSISALTGLNRAVTMPVVAGTELFATGADLGLFLLLDAAGQVLKILFYIAILAGLIRAVLMTGIALFSNAMNGRREKPAINPDLLVSVLIPAYNEERVIESTIRQVLASRNAQIEIIVIDDGSRDATAAVVTAAFGDHPAVRLVTVPNGGKAKALNLAVELARGDVLIALDADTMFGLDTIARLQRWFADPRIGAVAGNVQVGNRINLVTRWQSIEYITSQNLERRALAALNAVMVVPGAVGAFRRAALAQSGGYPEETLAEDQDLTIQIQRDGWRVIYDPAALAWTEAPETFLLLARQRFRWSFGTLQCLWKHRSILWTGRPWALAYIGIPQSLLFQIGFSLIAPVIDLLLVLNIALALTNGWQHGAGEIHGDGLTMLLFWFGFTTIDALCGYAAYKMEPRRLRFPFLLLIAQRFIYRQLMYWVVIRAVVTALRGPSVRWGKPKRSGQLGKPRRRWFPLFARG